MELSFPVFVLCEDDQSVDKIDTYENLINWYEKIDIEANFYSGWDINGIFFRLYLDNEKTKVRIISTENQKELLKKSITNYANLMRPEPPFEYPGSKDDVERLFHAAKEHIDSGRLTNKIKSFFQNLWREFRGGVPGTRT